MFKHVLGFIIVDKDHRGDKSVTLFKRPTLTIFYLLYVAVVFTFQNMKVKNPRITQIVLTAICQPFEQGTH